MKIKITDGPQTMFGKGGTPGPKKALSEYYDRLKEFGYNGPKKIGDMQKWMVQNHPDEVIAYMRADPSRLTNKGRSLYGNKAFDKLTGEELLNAYQDDLWDYRDPSPRKGKQGRPDIEDDPQPINNNLYTKDEQKEYLYEAAKSKNPYQKRNLPFYQAAPELAGYVNALNSYGYYTPDFTHQEINAPTLNIQPQLQSIDSSLNAVNDMTTGNPALDNARRSMAFTQALNAKQQAFANKQNYDAEGRYKADVYNNTARNQEQNLDVEATNTVHNTYRAEAKDLAEQERMNSINSLVEKQAKHNANETKKKLWLDNFYQNVEFDEDGNLKIKGNEMKFDRNPYGNIETDEPEYTTSGAPKIYPTGSNSNTGIYGFDIEDPKPIVPEMPKLIERSKTGIPLLPSTPLKRLKPGEDREDLIPTPNTNIPFLQPGNKIPLDFSKPITKLSKGGKYRLPL